MKRTPLRRKAPMRQVSEKQAERAREMGRPKINTPCNWCGSHWGEREWDHVIPRSLLPGENRDHRDNRVASCRRDNQRRAEGWTPAWGLLPERVQRFVIQQKGPIFAARYFADVPEELE